jgi:hypothetical protein
VALPLPSIWAIGNAVILALLASAAAGLFVYALRTFSRVPWLPDAIGVAILFCLTLESSVTAKQLPSTILGTLIAALILWALVRYVLGANLLAYPLAVLIAQLLLGGATLLQNQRQDLIVNGIVMLVAAAAAALWAALPREVPSAGVDANPLAALEAQALPGVAGDGSDGHLHRG